MENSWRDIVTPEASIDPSAKQTRLRLAAVAIVVQLAAEIVENFVMIGLFRDGLLDSGFNFGCGKILEARLQFAPGSKSEFGGELRGLRVFVRLQTVDGPEFDEKLFLMTLRAVPPTPDKVHGTMSFSRSRGKPLQDAERDAHAFRLICTSKTRIE